MILIVPAHRYVYLPDDFQNVTVIFRYRNGLLSVLITTINHVVAILHDINQARKFSHLKEPSLYLQKISVLSIIDLHHLTGD